MGKKQLADHLVGRLPIEGDAERGERAPELRKALRVAVDERAVEIEEKRRPGHIVAPICHGVNSASP